MPSKPEIVKQALHEAATSQPGIKCYECGFSKHHSSHPAIKCPITGKCGYCGSDWPCPDHKPNHGIKDLARLLNVSERTIFRWHEKGTIPKAVIYIGDSPRWTQEQVTRILNIRHGRLPEQRAARRRLR